MNCCNEWEPKSKVINDVLILQQIRTGWKLPMDIAFLFCPWCGVSRANIATSKLRDSTVIEAPGQMNKLVPIEGSTGEKT